MQTPCLHKMVPEEGLHVTRHCYKCHVSCILGRAIMDRQLRLKVQTERDRGWGVG